MATHIHNGEFQVDPKTFFRGDLPNWAKVPKSGEHFYFTKLNGDSIYGGKHVDASHKKMGPHKEAMEEFVISLLGKLVNGKRQGGWLDEVKMSPIGGGAGGASYGSATIGGVDKRGGHEGGKLGPPAWFRSLRQKKEIEAARHILHGINKLMMDLAEDDTLGYSKKALAEMFASQKRYGSVMACEGSIYTSFQLNLVNFSVANDPEKFYHKKSEGLELHTDPGNDYSDISAKLELTLMPRGFCEARLYLPETGICYPGTQFSYSLFRGLATHFVAPPFLVDPAAFKQQNTDGPELREPNTEDAFGEIGPYCRLSIIAYRHGSPLRQHKPWYFLEVPYMAKLGAKVFRNDAKGADPYTQLLNDAALRELIELMNGQPASIVKRKELAYKLEKGKIIPKGTSKFLVGQSCFNSLPAIGTGSHSATGLLNWGGKRCALTLRTVRMKMGYAKAAEPKYATRLILHPEHMDITKMTDKELDKELERAGVWDAYVTDARKEQVERTKAKAARNSSKQNGAQAAKNVGNANGEKQDSGDNEVIEYDHHLVASFSRDIDRLKDLATDEQDANGNIIRKKWEHPLTPGGSYGPRRR
ncbi:hypothetical protein DFJ74DRAFT_187419 [Hyaloraphidium curvatum]|nr:hypothetical protein DFJ74DRAFT_187419 [Hyaloraphidium curvatum]